MKKKIPLFPPGRFLAALSLLFFSLSDSAAKTSQFDFTLPDLAGKYHSLSDYKGKILIIDFWAVWCITCREMFPILNKIRKNNASTDVAVIGISIDKKPAEFVKKFVALSKLQYTILHDKKNKTPEQYAIQALPSLFVLAPDGALAYSHTGALKDGGKKLEAVILKLSGQLKNKKAASAVPGPPAGDTGQSAPPETVSFPESTAVPPAPRAKPNHSE